LRAIDGFSQALLEDCSDQLDDHGKDYLVRVRAGSQRMAQLIDDLLDLSRVTRSAFAHQPVNLSIMAESVLAGLKKKEPQRQVDCAITSNLTVAGDERLLRVALENLLGNAWKFTGKRAAARIEFGMIRNGNTPIYYVRDNGAGFDMAYMDKLFGPFQRLHAMKEFEGTGIGLATVQRIIHRHGGQVWAEAEVGKGATFHFTLD
jgi:light-regulated signal transduction histidine kinase (bacteriophytochrome)